MLVLTSCGVSETVTNSQKISTSEETVSENTKINLGDKVGLVERVLGKPIRSRTVQDPTDNNLSIHLLDYQAQTGSFAFEIQNATQAVTTKSITFVVKNGIIEKIVPNPNNPADPQRSTLKGTPGFATSVVVID